MRRIFMAAVALAVTTALALAAFATAKPKPKPKPKKGHPAPTVASGALTGLPPGFSTYLLSNSCDDRVVSTESGATYDMPDDFDNNQLVRGPHGAVWLVNNHELTKPVPGDFQGDATKCFVPEQARHRRRRRDGWGSVSRLTLSKDGTPVTKRELITTGLHNLCAGALTPWKTFLTNEEFPFVADPGQRSGWVWEIEPATGAQKRATGMGRYSHEQEALSRRRLVPHRRPRQRPVHLQVRPRPAARPVHGQAVRPRVRPRDQDRPLGRAAGPARPRGRHGRECRPADRGELVLQARGHRQGQARQRRDLLRVGVRRRSGSRLDAHRPQATASAAPCSPRATSRG